MSNFEQGGFDHEAERPLSEAEQMIVDSFAPLHEAAAMLQSRDMNTAISDDDYNRLSLIKRGVESITDQALPQTHTFNTAQRGVEVDVSLNSTFFEQLTAVHTVLAETQPLHTVDGVFQGINEKIISNFELLMQNARTGAVGSEKKTYHGVHEAMFEHARYASLSGYSYVSRRLMKASRESGYEKEFDKPQYDELLDSPSWRTAYLLDRVSHSVAAAKTEGRKLTDEEKMPAVKALSRFGFNEKEARSILGAAWSRNPDNKSVQYKADIIALKVVNTLDAIEALAEIDADAPLKAHQVFGIRNFDRYKAAQLARQLDAEFQPDMVAISAVADWNGAFGKFGTEVEELCEAPIFVEAVSPLDMVDRLEKLKTARIPLRSVIVAGHGDESLIQLGRKKDQVLTKDIIEQTRSLRQLVSSGLIEKGCRLVLLSCNTGHKGGIAESIAALPGLESVQAPDFISMGIRRSEEDPSKFVYKKDDGHDAGVTHSFSKHK